MLTEFSNLSPGVQVTGYICLALVLITGAVQWRKMRQREMDHEFARDLFERGLSPEEVERIIRANGAKGRGLLRQFAELHWGTKAGLLFLAFMIFGMIFSAVNTYIFWVARR